MDAQTLFKKIDFVWKRFRKRLKKAPSEEQLKEKVPILNTFIELQHRQAIDLYFSDQTGFGLTPSVPYGWQPKGSQTSYPTQHQHLYNVLGLLNPATQHLVIYPTTKGHNIDTAFVIQAFDNFANTLKRPTVVVIDNAPWHTSKLFKEQIERWQQQQLYLFYLPPYSPHLNLIETLWRMIKYKWLQPKDFRSKNALQNKLNHIFAEYGSVFIVNFSMNFFII